MTELALPVPGGTFLDSRDRAGWPDPQRALEAAYAAHAGRLTARLTARTRDSAAAEDLVHEAFLKLAVELRAGRTPENVGGWLHRVTTNLLVSGARHSAVAARHQAFLAQPAIEPSPEAASIRAEEANLLRAALGTLGTADREALLLAAQGYRGREIARRIGRSEGATRTLMCRARTRLRRSLEAAGIEG